MVEQGMKVLGAGAALALLLCMIVAYPISRAIYNIYFHPLRHYPGPRLWAASRIPWNFHSLSGRLAWKIRALHGEYGPVVRIAPDELSFTTSSAWKTIYGTRSPEFEKCLDGRGIVGPPAKNKGALSMAIISAPQDKHARLRRAISPGFSDRALRDQEGFLQAHTNKLIAQLRRNCEAGPLDMVRWFSLTTFDVISDLAFGEPAGCLDNADQPWLQVIGSRARTIVWYQLTTYYNLGSWVEKLQDKKAIAARAKHVQLTAGKVQERLNSHAQGNDRKDLMSYILDNVAEKLSNAELIAMASSFIVAGSGTAATALSGIAFFLGRNPDKYARLAEEVRSAFKKEGDITIESTSRLAYLKAVIDEGMRMYPPSPSTLPRFVPGKGCEIDGKWVPGGTAVGVHQFSCGNMGWNFHEPASFLPERWLEEGKKSHFMGDDKHAAQPFSYGPRNCIGRNLAYAEMKMILAKLLWNFDFGLVENSDRWLEEQEIFLIWEKGPLMVNLRPRM